MKYVTISVDPDVIRATADEFRSNAETLSSQSLNLSFARSSGAVVSELNDLSASLLALGEVVSGFATKMAWLLDKAADDFEFVDFHIIDVFPILKERMSGDGDSALPGPINGEIGDTGAFYR